MRAAWFVRTRQMETRFKFWLAIIGYNKNDRSLSHKLYLVYAVVFFILWGFAVLTLLASSGAVLLNWLNPADPVQAAVRLAWLALLAWGVYTLFQATRRSPFIFSEDDAYLICQTPVDRRAVALAWFPGDWLVTAGVFWAGAVVLGFSLSELSIGAKIGITDIPVYVASGLRAMGGLLPAQLGLQALLWAVGAVRLWRDQGPAWLRPAALSAAALASAGVVWSVFQGGLGGGFSTLAAVLTWPLLFPLQAAFGQAPLAAGLVAGACLGAAGLVVLYFSSGPLNLSRAAQETHDMDARQATSRSGSGGLAQELADQARLGVGHATSRLPAMPDLWALPWKDLVQSFRLVRLGDIAAWIILVGSALGVAFLPSMEGRALALAYWVINAGQRGTLRFRRDLAQWSILRQLPFPVGRLIIADLAPAWLMVAALSMLSLAPLLGQVGIWAAAAFVLVLPVSAGIVFLSAHDIIRQASVAALMVGNAPEVSARGAAFGLVLTALPLALLLWLGVQPGALEASLVISAAVSVALAVFAWWIAAGAVAQVE